MPTLNVDEEKGVVEPIEVVLDGKKYAITKVTNATMRKTTELVEAFKDSDNPEHGLAAQMLGLYFGVDPEEFAEVDERKLMRANTFVQETITQQFEGKQNPTRAKAKN